MDKNDIHESHDIEEDYDFAVDPHNPAWYCKTCRLTSCCMCKTGEGLDDEELAARRIGYSTWDQITVQGDDGITHKVKRCRTGWFEKRKEQTS